MCNSNLGLGATPPHLVPSGMLIVHQPKLLVDRLAARRHGDVVGPIARAGLISPVVLDDEIGSDLQGIAICTNVGTRSQVRMWRIVINGQQWCSQDDLRRDGAGQPHFGRGAFMASLQQLSGRGGISAARGPSLNDRDFSLCAASVSNLDAKDFPKPFL